MIGDAAARRAPHRIVAYAQEVAADFHVFYKHCRVIGVEPVVCSSRLALCVVTKRVIARCLDLAGCERSREHVVGRPCRSSPKSRPSAASLKAGCWACGSARWSAPSRPCCGIARPRRWSPSCPAGSIQAVDRLGKFIIVRLDGERFLTLHLGMTGQLLVDPADVERAHSLQCFA